MKLERQHPDHPANNGRIGDRVARFCDGQGQGKWKTGVITKVGIPPEGRGVTQVEISYDDCKQETCWPGTSGLLIFVPQEELDQSPDLADWMKGKRLHAVRFARNGDEALYSFVGAYDGSCYPETSIEVVDTQRCDLRYDTDGRGFYNNKPEMVDGSTDLVCGDRKIDLPEEFELDV